MVAARLVDTRLAPVLGVDRLNGEAARLLAAVAAALAHALVDDDAVGGRRRLAALARAAQLRRALLVVDQHGHTLDGRQFGLRRGQIAALAQLGTLSQADALVAPGVLGGHDDPPDTLQLEQAGQLGHRHPTLQILAPGHRHGAVGEQLVGHVGARGHRGADGQGAGVEEGPVAHVLCEVVDIGEGRHADPLGTLSSHLRHAGDGAAALGAQQHHRVAADSRAHQLAVGRGGGAVVRAARAEERGARGGPASGHGQHERTGARGVERTHARLHRVEPDAAREACRDCAGDPVHVQVQLGAQQLGACLVALADDARSVSPAVEQFLELALHERALLLDHQNLFESGREGPGDLGLERPDHAEVQDPHARSGERTVVQPQLGERLAEVGVARAGGNNAEPSVVGPVDAIHAVGAGVGEREIGSRSDEAALELRRVRRQEVGAGLVRVVLGHRRGDGHDPVRPDLGRRRAVGDGGHDLQGRPQARRARAGDSVQAEVEDLLHAAREEDGHAEAREHRLGCARQSRGLAGGVVPDEREAAAGTADSGVVAVTQGVRRAVEAGGLAVPDAEHAVVAGPRQGGGQLAAPGGRGARLLVEPGHMDEVVLAADVCVAGQLAVEPSEWRSLVAGDKGCGVQAVAAVGAVLVQRHTHERLHSGQEDAAALEQVAVVERHVGEAWSRGSTAGAAIARRTGRALMHGRRRQENPPVTRLTVNG